MWAYRFSTKRDKDLASLSLGPCEYPQPLYLCVKGGPGCVYGAVVKASQSPASWVCSSVHMPGILEHGIWGVLLGNITEAELCSEGPRWVL